MSRKIRVKIYKDANGIYPDGIDREIPIESSADGMGFVSLTDPNDFAGQSSSPRKYLLRVSVPGQNYVYLDMTVAEFNLLKDQTYGAGSIPGDTQSFRIGVDVVPTDGTVDNQYIDFTGLIPENIKILAIVMNGQDYYETQTLKIEFDHETQIADAEAIGGFPVVPGDPVFIKLIYANL